MEPGLVSVVLVTWNSARYLRRCLDGIAWQTHAPMELIAVDNASQDESVAMVEPHAARVIRNETNRGFSAAVNQAIAVARGELVLLLNPDCHLTPEYVALLVETLHTEPDAGSATGLLMRAKGFDIEPTEEIDSMGIRMTRTGRHLDITSHPEPRPSQHPEPPSSCHPEPRLDGGGSPFDGRLDAPSAGGPSPSTRLRMTEATPVAPANRQLPTANRLEVFGVSGAAALYRTSFLHDVAIDNEPFDEDFFAYREDADVAWRGRLFGWRAFCEPRAIAYHVRRVTPEARRELPAEINMHSVKNRWLLRLKNQGAYLALRNAPFELFRDLVVILASVTVERTSLPAFAWLWRNRARVLAKRREIQRRRKVSDRALVRWFA